MKKHFKSMDGNEAAAYISYAFTEVAAIYPITPSSPMAQSIDVWAAHGKKNIFGQVVQITEMQAEYGACAAMHGALNAGGLATTYTASQGLMLMIPPMFRIAGELLPGVMHVAARTVGTHAMSIFGDHSDVMACRQTGFAMLSSGGVQEVMDLAGVAHLSAIKGRVPFIHFFDGFRTSHEIQKVEVLDYEDLDKLVDKSALDAFRKNAMNSEHPAMRSSVQNPDTFFQCREASNTYYDAVPDIVQGYMDDINALTGRDYHLFNYYGAPDAERVVVAMGSTCDTLREVVDYLSGQGEKVGLVQVHLFRPFSMSHFISALPDSVKTITTLDRTKEPGAIGEPLYEDICTAVVESGRSIKVLGGRYGLSSKDVSSAQMKAVFDNMVSERTNHFTVGIDDDLTFHSIPVGENIVTSGASIKSCKFWGLGSDGTVGANKNSIKIIGDNTDQYVQAYFEYDAKKSGGVTKSHLRFGHEPIRSAYYVTLADFVACHNQNYMSKYDIVTELKPGGIFLLNSSWNDEEIEKNLPNRAKRIMAEKKVSFYVIDATGISESLGLGSRTNTVLQSAFFKLANILPIDEAVAYMKEAIAKSYGAKGEKVLAMNFAAVDSGLTGLRQIPVPENWKELKDEQEQVDADLPEYARVHMRAINAQKGDLLPVSAFKNMADGTVPVGMSKYEKRGIAVSVPHWIPENCIGCNTCALVCSHAAIRPFLLNDKEAAAAPEGFVTNKSKGKEMVGLTYRIQVDPLDCQGCGSCASSCPAKEKALVMKHIDSELPEQKNWDYCLSLPEKTNPLNKFSVRGSQFEQPLLEFSGACAGCGETPYMKLLTQLFGDRMYVANATGCSQAWGFSPPAFPYTVNSKGRGPAMSGSLFENIAEYGQGMSMATEQQRQRLAEKARLLADVSADTQLSSALRAWIDGYNSADATRERSDAVMLALSNTAETGELVDYIRDNADQLVKKSIWLYGGDGWAYDIDFGGLDHVMASGVNVNVLVVDTEVYSNTGGQASKATPIGAVAQFSSAGKKVGKKELGMMLMNYGNIYIAQVALGANPTQVIKAMKEAEEFDGPSVIIAYAPCINHGIVKGMSYAQQESKLAVQSGYWPLFRYIPDNKALGKNPFVLDSAEPSVPLREFLMGEVRYASLTRTFPDRAEILMAEAEKQAKERYERYKKLAENA